MVCRGEVPPETPSNSAADMSVGLTGWGLAMSPVQAYEWVVSEGDRCAVLGPRGQPPWPTPRSTVAARMIYDIRGERGGAAHVAQTVLCRWPVLVELTERGRNRGLDGLHDDDAPPDSEWSRRSCQA